jgi:hypothetical protein
VASNEWYSQCIPGSGGGNPTTTRAGTTARTTTRAVTTTAGGNNNGGTGLTTVFPNSAGASALPTARVVSGTFDGGMVRYDRNRKYLLSIIDDGRD